MDQDYNNGPNQIIPSDSYITTEPNGRVRLKIPEIGKAIETVTPISVPGLLHRTTSKYPDNIALAQKQNGKWIKITYKEYENLVRTCAKAFLHLGLERYHAVCILGFNSPEWFISDLAAIYGGGFSAGIYTTNSSEACFHCCENSKANIVVVQDDKQLEKILKIRSRLPHLKAIIQYEGTLSKEAINEGVLTWKQVMEIGDNQSDEKLNDVLKNLAVNECCTLVYTSGTVGQPKAVMLSHDNLTWDAMVLCERVLVNWGNEVFVSYLPLSHVAAQVVDIYVTISVGATVYFGDKDSLKGSLVYTLQEVQPTIFLGVPRVWEKIYEKMMQIGAQNGTIKKAIASWAKGHGLQHNLDKINGINSNTWSYILASSLIFKKIKQALGFNRCKLFVSAAAPLSADVKKYFLSIDIPLMEAFGMSEGSGAHTLCTENAFNLDTIGTTLPGMKSKLHNPDEKGNGELCMYGRHVFMGYLGEPEKTSDALDSEGWLHSGDLSCIDDKGLIYITGRLKELIITAGGENVAPVPTEQLVKAELPQVSNAFLVGDKRKFLSVLLTFKTEINQETGAPLDTLLPTVQEWLKELGCPATTVTELLKAGPDERLLASLRESIDRVNIHATSNAQRIQKLAILPADFSVPTGELGPTLKVKRNVIAAKYSDIIDEIYA